jgi:hypothetical protein
MAVGIGELEMLSLQRLKASVIEMEDGGQERIWRLGTMWWLPS